MPTRWACSATASVGLLLGANEEQGATVGDGLLHEVEGDVDVSNGLLQVDDVDAVALGEDEALHLRVPTASLVAEVDTGLEELTHGNDCHGSSFPRKSRVISWVSPGLIGFLCAVRTLVP